MEINIFLRDVEVKFIKKYINIGSYFFINVSG